MAETITALGAALRSGETTSVEVVTRLLAQPDEIGAYVTRFDSALAAATAADAELAAGRDRGPLHGIPLGIKDLLPTREGPTTAQSGVRHRWRKVRVDAEAVTRLRDAGAVLLGKTATMEFGVGGPVGQTGFPVPRNPWDPDHWTGGSSSGTANGVAAGLFPGGLGSDTAGSIRGPAAYCGITGFKPTYGLVPVAGSVPLAPSFDTVGPMARTAEDCALLLSALTGRDIGPLRGSLSGVRVGFAAFGTEFTEAVDVLRAAGAEVRPVEVPGYAALTTTTRLGYVTEGFAVHREMLREQWSAYAPQTRLALATGALLSGGDFARLLEVRAAGRRAVAELFESVDLLVTPTTTGPAPALRDLPRLRTIEGLHTPAWSATGQPALSVPRGFTSGGLPLGLQIIGRHHADELVLEAGHAFQLRTDWHRRVPAPVAGSVAPEPMPVRAEPTPPGSPVPALLRAAGLNPPEEDVDTVAARYPTVVAEVESLYRWP